MDQTSAKQRIVVDEHDMEGWPAIKREPSRPTPTENELKTASSSSAPTATTNMPAASQSNDQSRSMTTSTSSKSGGGGGGMINSIWSTGTVAGGWGSITTTAMPQSGKDSVVGSQFQQGLFSGPGGSALPAGTTGNSVWGSSGTPSANSDGENRKEPRSGWTGSSGSNNEEDNNGMDTQPSAPSTQGQGERMQTDSPLPTTTVTTSSSSWVSSKEQSAGANNVASSANGKTIHYEV